MGKEAHGRILSGVRVLDITDVVTGPLCTRYLADCGCEVIAIERPSGKAARDLPYTHNGLSVEYIANHCGKKSIAIDLKAKGARELVLELAKVCDVVVENFRPGVMTRFGLDYDSLKKANPSIIMCSITGYGQKGPYAKEMALDVIIQACRGIACMMGESGERPRFVSFAVTDILGALNAFGAICASLYRRGVTGEGEYIDIALADCTVAVLGNQVETHIFSGGKEEFRYMDGSFSGAVAPAGAFKGRDGYVAMFLITDEEWKRLAECMGRPELAVETRFRTVGDRIKHKEELARILDMWLQEFEQVKDAVALLQDHGLLAKPILSLAQALDEEQQIRDREMLVNMEHPILGTITCVNTPLCFSNNRAGLEEPPPVAVGEHSERILHEILSLDNGEIKKLRESGVVFGPDGQSTFSK